MGEPDYELKLKDNKEGILKISFNPKTNKWISNEWEDKQFNKELQ